MLFKSFQMNIIRYIYIFDMTLITMKLFIIISCILLLLLMGCSSNQIQNLPITIKQCNFYAGGAGSYNHHFLIVSYEDKLYWHDIGSSYSERICVAPNEGVIPVYKYVCDRECSERAVLNLSIPGCQECIDACKAVKPKASPRDLLFTALNKHGDNTTMPFFVTFDKDGKPVFESPLLEGTDIQFSYVERNSCY